MRVAARTFEVLTGICLPQGFDADRLRQLILARFDMSLGQGLGRLKGRMFRIGHLGDFNDLSLMGALSGVEMGLKAFGVPSVGLGCAGGAGRAGRASGHRRRSAPSDA